MSYLKSKSFFSVTGSSASLKSLNLSCDIFDLSLGYMIMA
jgi:hypothetical protein